MSFNFFRNNYAAIATLAKSMDNNIDSFCNNLISELETVFGLVVPDALKFKEEVVLKSFHAFETHTVKMKRNLKEEKIMTEKKRTTGFIIFNMEKREEIVRNVPESTFEEIGKIIGDEWKKLSHEEKEKYNREAAFRNGVEYREKVPKVKVEQHQCHQENCQRHVKTDPIDGVYLCAEHKKRMKKLQLAESRIQNDIIESPTQNTERTRSKNVNNKVSTICTKRSQSCNSIINKKEAQHNESEEEMIPKGKIIQYCKFRFDKESPVPLSNIEFWKTNGIKGSTNRIHLGSNLILNTVDDITHLIGLSIDGMVYEKCDLPISILRWCDKSGIIVDE